MRVLSILAALYRLIPYTVKLEKAPQGSREQHQALNKGPQVPFHGMTLQRFLPQSVWTSRVALSQVQNPALFFVKLHKVNGMVYASREKCHLWSALSCLGGEYGKSEQGNSYFFML